MESPHLAESEGKVCGVKQKLKAYIWNSHLLLYPQAQKISSQPTPFWRVRREIYSWRYSAGKAWASEKSGLQKTWRDFPGGAVVRNLPTNAGDTGTVFSSRPLIAHIYLASYSRSLVWEDHTCHGATKPMHHNYRACALEPASHNY